MKNTSEPEKKDPALLPPPGVVVQFEKELDYLATLRKLSPKGEIQGLRVETPDLISHVKQAVELETPAQALNGTEAMLVGLGAVPLDFDYRKTMLSLLTERLAGMYQPRLKMMLLREGLEGNLKTVTLLHELVHALQDQHFDLSEIIEWSEDDTDRSSALSCLAEGDATSAMWDGLLGEGKTALSLPEGYVQDAMRADPPKGVPSLISKSLIAPYVDGVTFVHQLRARAGWEEVNRVWKDPPTTTEQILHLEKYDAKEPALLVAVPPPPSEKDGTSKWTTLLHDTWGEQNLGLLLAEWMSEDAAKQAATGWGGDRIVAYERGDDLAVAWDVSMDSSEEAAQLFTALKKIVQADSATASRAPSGDAKNSFCGTMPSDFSVPLAVTLRGPVVSLRTGTLSRPAKRVGHCVEAMGW